MRLGDYEVLSEIGKGAHARVLRARAPSGALVALKLLAAGASHEAFARFAREARLQGALGAAEGFVPLLATGVAPEGPFLVLPLLERGTLRRRLVRGPLSVEETLALGRALASALGWAHERGVVHRDLKPENVLFAADGRPLIADLGLAKHFTLAPTSSESLTGSEEFLGTPGYMAPEQLDGAKEAGAPADVFALGAILYECLTGRAPFSAATLTETVVKTSKASFAPLEGVPAFLAHPIAVALSKERERRYEDGFAFAQALGQKTPRRARGAKTVPEKALARPPAPGRVVRAALFVLALAALALFLVTVVVPRGPAPVAAPSPQPASKPLEPPRARGWAGEPLPEGVRRGTEAPLYVFDTGRGLELVMVYVPPGDFLMGAIQGGPQEKPLHTHSVAKGFYLERTELTWDEFSFFAKETGAAAPARPAAPISGSYPVVNVSCEEAERFCLWAGLALPSEAEWEKAARGSEGARQWPWGDEWRQERALTSESGARGTQAVGSAPEGASPAGALDMAGSVYEWTADWYDATIYQAYSNGVLAPPRAGSGRVVRGGSFRGTRFDATVSARTSLAPSVRRDDVGFRPCRRAP